MFTGIIEDIGEVVAIKKNASNMHFSLKSSITSELKVDQSISHNGVCLTVVHIKDDIYTVIAINETLEKTMLSHLKVGDQVNLERSIKIGSRLDGHMVQGHVDQIATCIEVKEVKGSHILTFEYKDSENITVEKGSICVNGVSFTVINSKDHSFSVAIIPYTFKHTNLHAIHIGSLVNIEFDVLGKYITKLFIKNI